MHQRILPAIAAGFFALAALQPNHAGAHGGAMIGELQAVNAKLDAMVVPFTVAETTGGLCDSAGSGTSVPEITIDSDGTEGHFVITSVLILTASPGVPATGLRGFSINHVDIDGERFYTRTGDLLGRADGVGVHESVDLMGTPIRRNGDADAPIAGGNFPHQIVAISDDINDVSISMFCASDDDDLSFYRIQVSGWKRPADTITVTFTPGS